jgi:hypothetical protein
MPYLNLCIYATKVSTALVSLETMKSNLHSKWSYVKGPTQHAPHSCKPGLLITWLDMERLRAMNKGSSSQPLGGLCISTRIVGMYNHIPCIELYHKPHMFQIN